MNFNLIIIVAILVYLDRVQGIGSGAFFNFIRQRVSRASATQCVRGLNYEKCKFNANDLNLDAVGSIVITVKESGRKIMCNHKPLLNRNNWYGECDGDAQDANFVKRKDHQGKERVFGSIRVGSEVCQFSPNADGVSEVTCVPNSQFKDEEEPLEAPETVEKVGDRNLRFGYTPSANLTDATYSMRGSASREADGRRLYDNSGANIDVMVVWTNEAECGNSGLSKGCLLTPTTESNMRGRIDLAVQETNTAFVLSGINTMIRLVHAYRDPNYVEPTTNAFSTALTNLKTPADGYLDSVHAKRTLYGADAVQMIIGSGGSCGIAYMGPTKNFMFSVSAYNCATGYYSFGHELMHNLNANHDRGTTVTCGNSTYNYGYRDPNAAFRTILAYDCAIGQCDKMPKTGCPRVQRFSNPNVLYNGAITGSATSNNARQINEQIATVASFFPAMNCGSNSECNDGDPSTADTCNVAIAVCVFTPIPAPAVTAAPITAPTVAVAPITAAPITPPTKAPITAAPITAAPATKAPITAAPATKAPIAATPATTVPAVSPTISMEAKVVTGVVSAAWTSVSLVGMYVSPIPVCTVKYDTSRTMLPAVLRMRNVGTRSFEIRLQNPSNAVLSSRDVHCVIVEEGSWSMPDGRKIEAKKYLSTITDRKASWTGQKQNFTNTYTAPIVLGQVMSYNDVKWSVFWCRGSATASGPIPTQLFTGKHVGEDRTTTRASETVGFIVIESGHATSGGIEIETRRGPDLPSGYVQSTYTYSFATPFATTPVVAVVSQVAMDESDGSWAVLTSNPTTNLMGLAVDEDQIGDSERKHTNEELNYAVFSAAGSIRLNRLS